jgi:hypothetical protein
MDEAGVITTQQQCDQGATDHGHQRVHRHQTTDRRQLLRRHHIETKPADDQDPGAQRQHGNIGRSEADSLAIADSSTSGAEQDHGDQTNPAAHRVNHHGAGKVMERRAELALQPLLHPEPAVPGDPFEQRIDQAE